VRRYTGIGTLGEIRTAGLDVGDDVRPRAQGSGSGVFLTQQDAEAAQAILAPRVRSCWIEMLPVVL
jgi:hypothetical protein